MPIARPRRPSSSGMRAERSSAGGLDAVGNGGLHTIEEEEAAEDDEGDGGAGSEKEQARGLAAAGEGPAEAVNDAGHGGETAEPAPTRGTERGRTGDGRSAHPELDEERNEVEDDARK